MTAVLPRATVMAHERTTRATLSPTRARPLLPATAAPPPPPPPPGTRTTPLRRLGGSYCTRPACLP